jgi:hypothetical protein
MTIGPENRHGDNFVVCGQAGTPVVDCLVIDVHTHIGPCHGIPIPDSSIEALIAQMDLLGIDLAYVSGLPAVMGVADKMGNDMVLDAMGRYRDRIRGYMALNVASPDTILPEMQRCYDAGMGAVKIYSYGLREGLQYNHPTYEIIFEFADAHSLPVLAHTWGDELDQLEQSFQKYPHIRWLLAHTGSKDLPKYIKVAKEFENVYLETCFSACPRGLFEKLVSEVPLYKIVWGSDQLFISATHQLGRVLFAQLSSEQKQAILGANAATLFGETGGPDEF